MPSGGASRLLRRLPWAAALITFACCVLVPTAALAITSGRVTLNQDTGGKPARFTVVAVTDVDTATASAELTFPRGFDLSAVSTISVDTLKGVQVTHVTASPTISGTAIRLTFVPPVSPGSQLRVLIYDVNTPFQGGTYALGMSYVAGGQTRKAAGLEFSYSTPAWAEIVSRWLDTQALAQRWNSVKLLNMFFSPQLIVQGIYLAFAGWLVSLALVGVAFPLAIVGGLVLAFVKMSRIFPFGLIARMYINVIRGTPLFLQIYIVFIGLPMAGVHIQWFASGCGVLALNSSAYLAEIFRAGIESINRGQFEAAASLGMTYPQAMRYVIIPQTVRRVLPTMTSEFILLFKDTALLFAVGVFELMMFSNEIVARAGNLTPFMVAAGFYLIVTIPLISWVARLEARLAVSEGGQAAAQPARKRRGVLKPAPEQAGGAE